MKINRIKGVLQKTEKKIFLVVVISTRKGARKCYFVLNREYLNLCFGFIFIDIDIGVYFFFSKFCWEFVEEIDSKWVTHYIP